MNNIDELQDKLNRINQNIVNLAEAREILQSKIDGIKTTDIIDFDYLKCFMRDVFMSYGTPEKESTISADVLIESDKRGIDSHGIGRLKPIYCDRIEQGILHPYKPIDIIKETETSALVDGNLGMGLYIGPYCMNLAIEKAKKHGVGFVAVQNSTHYGIAGYYTTMAADAGCVGFSGTNARPSIAPTFGTEPMLGTNPMCFGMPTDDGFPFCIDCATSVNQRGKIERYEREGIETPKGAVIDDNGIERTDTSGILRDMQMGKCALTPVGGAGDKMGGYKGYGWATTIELLCTAFQSGPFGEDVCGIDRKTGDKKSMPLGHFFLAIDIEPLCPLQTFTKNSSNLLNALRDSKKAPGEERIWTAGEQENNEYNIRKNQGGVYIPDVLQQNMIDLRNKLHYLRGKYPKFPFEK
jgi:LDH2 family malate/lactate/ureidoglycolate dehydrogenase